MVETGIPYPTKNMADEEIEKIDSENDPSADDENTDLEDEGSDETSNDTEDDAADDKSEGEGADDEDKPKFTDRERKLYIRTKKAEAELKKLKGIKADPKVEPAKNKTVDVSAEVQAALDRRDLEALDLPDEVKTEIKNYAKLHKLSILAAAKSPYIAFMKSEADKKARAEEAATGTKRKSQPRSDFKDSKPEDFDLSTEQGRKDWDAYKQYLKNS